MGVEFHITRAEFWANNAGSEISAEEWLAYATTDIELCAYPANGKYYFKWMGASKYETPWLEWFQGNISTKWPDSALYQKMLKIATALNANVQDDEGTVYIKESDWGFDPK